MEFRDEAQRRYCLPDASSFEALEFLERSRDVAGEVVIDGTSREISTSRCEENIAAGSGVVMR